MLQVQGIIYPFTTYTIPLFGNIRDDTVRYPYFIFNLLLLSFCKAVVLDKHVTTAFPNLPEHNSTSLIFLTETTGVITSAYNTSLTHQSPHSNEVQLLP